MGVLTCREGDGSIIGVDPVSTTLRDFVTLQLIPGCALATRLPRKARQGKANTAVLTLSDT